MTAGSPDPPATEPASAAQLQGALLDAAEECFARFGLRKTTMEDVARAGGVSRATLYRYFKNRDELLLGVVEREARAAATNVMGRLAGIEHPGEHLVEGFVQALEEIPKHPTLAMVVDPESVGMTNKLVISSERLANIAREVMVPVMRPAQDSGLLRDNVDVAVMIEWIFRLLTSYLAAPSFSRRRWAGRRQRRQRRKWESRKWNSTPRARRTRCFAACARQ